MDGNDILEPRGRGGFYGIIIAEAAVLAIILISLITIKYFFGDCYAEIKSWYETSLCDETEASEVTDIPDGDVDEV